MCVWGIVMGILSERFLLALVVCVGIVMGILSERFLLSGLGLGCVCGGIVMGILSERFLLALVVCGWRIVTGLSCVCGNSDGNIE